MPTLSRPVLVTCPKKWCQCTYCFHRSVYARSRGTTWHSYMDTPNGSIEHHCYGNGPFSNLGELSLRPPPKFPLSYSISLQWCRSLFKVKRVFVTTACIVLNHVVWLLPQPFQTSLCGTSAPFWLLILISVPDHLPYLSHYTVNSWEKRLV